MVAPTPESLYRTPQFALGALVQRYPRSRRRIASLCAIVAVFLALGSALGTMTVLEPPPPDDLGGWATIAALASLVLGPLGLVLYGLRNAWTASLALYEEGLVATRGGASVVCRWDDVREYHQTVTRLYVNGIGAGTYRDYRIVMVDGTRVRLQDSVRDVADACRAIERQIFPRLYRQATAALAQVGAAHFGRLAVSPHGITRGRATLAWSDVLATAFEAGHFRVRARGKWLPWASVQIGSIPNVAVLAALCDELRARVAERAAVAADSHR